MSVMYDPWHRMKFEPCERTQTGDAALRLANEFMGSTLLSEVQQGCVLREHASGCKERE